MSRLAEIDNGLVKNIIIGELEDFPTYINVDGKFVGPGFTTTDNINFIPPVKVVSYITDVIATEFIGLFTFDEWSEIKNSTSTNVKKFIAALESYPNKFDTGHARIVSGMQAIVAAGDITMDITRAQEIVKGILE